MSVNAIEYIKNVGKSFGYASADYFKEKNPAVGTVIKNSITLTKEVNNVIKDTRSKVKGNNVKEIKYLAEPISMGKELIGNIFSDIKTGKFYNKGREDEVTNQMNASLIGGDDDFDFDFDFDDDDDDIGIDDDDNSSSNDTAAITSTMDAVGSKVSQAVSMATAKSAQYIAASSSKDMSALLNQNNRLFGQVNTGLAAINSNVSALVALGRDVSTHIQNSGVFFTKSTELQTRQVELLEKLVTNTAPIENTPQKGYRNSNKRISDILGSDDILDIGEYIKAIKDNISEQLSFITGMNDMFKDENGEGVSMFKMIASNPGKFILPGIVETLIPEVLNKTMESFNESLSGFFGSLLMKINKASSNNDILNSILGFLNINNRLKTDLDPSLYKKDKVDFDGITRKSIIEVIPTYLSKILSSLNGKEETRYDYAKGEFVKMSKIKEERDYIIRSKGNSAGWDIKDEFEKKFKDIPNQKELLKSLEDFFAKSIEKGEIFNYRDKNISDDKLKEFGLTPKAGRMLIDLLKDLEDNDKGHIATNFNKEIAIARDRITEIFERMEETGEGVITNLYNGSIDEKNKITSPFNLNNIFDEYHNNVFYYLRGIYQYTQHVSDNIKYLGSGGGGNVKSSGTGKPSSKRAFTRVKDIINNTPVSEESKDVEEVIYTNLEYDKLIRDIDSKYMTKEILSYEKYAKMSSDERDKYITELLKAKKKTEQSKAKSKKFKEDAHDFIGKITGGIYKLFNKPAELASDVLKKANKVMLDIIYGKDREKDKGFLGTILDETKKLFTRFGKWADENIFKKFQTSIKDIIDKLFGKKGEDGKRRNGWFGKVGEGISENFKNAGNWVKGSFKDVAGSVKDFFTGKNKNNAYSGGNVTKTGLVAVSEGEMIIPSEYNPFFKGKTDKEQQRIDETNIVDRFFGSYRKGTKSVKAKAKRAAKRTARRAAKNVAKNVADKVSGKDKKKKDEESFADKAVNKAKKTASAAKDKLMGTEEDPGIVREMGKTVKSGINKVFDGLFGSEDEQKKKDQEKLKETVNTVNKEIGVPDNISAIITGGIIGGGISLLTGGLVSPLLGAAAGGAAGLVLKSDKVQKALFGDDEKDGLLPKKIGDFVKNKLPNIAKFATVGGIAGLLGPIPGGPVGGIILGSALSYAVQSEELRDWLLGNEEKGKKGKISKELQEKIKKAVPNMAVGAAAGLVAGPFGIAGNLIFGAALGYATTTQSFQEKLFGKDGNSGLIKEIRERVLQPLQETMKTVAQEIKFQITNLFRVVGNTLSNVFKDTIIIPFERFFKSTVLKPLGAIAKVALAPVAGVAYGGFKAITGLGGKLRENQIRKGRANDMMAKDRVQYRKKHNMNLAGDKTYVFDNTIKDMDDESVSQFKDYLHAIQNPGKEIQKDADEKLRGLTASLSDVDDLSLAKIYSISSSIRDKDTNKALKKFDKAMSKSKLPPEKIAELRAQIASGSQEYTNIKDQLGDVNTYTQKQIKELKKKFGVDIDAKEAWRYEKLLDGELKGREKLEKAKTPEMKQSDDHHKELISKMKEIVDELKILTGRKTAKEVEAEQSTGTAAASKTVKGVTAPNVNTPFTSSDNQQVEANPNEINDGITVVTDATNQAQSKNKPSNKVTQFFSNVFSRGPLAKLFKKDEDENVKWVSTATGELVRHVKNGQGEWVPDNSDKESDAIMDKQREVQDAQITTAKSLSGLGGTLGGLLSKLFGKKEDDKPNLLDKLKEKFSEGFSKLSEFVTGGGLANVISLGASSIVSTIGAGLVIKAFLGSEKIQEFVDMVANAITGGGNDPKNSKGGYYYDKRTDSIDIKGKSYKIKVDKNGNPVKDGDGNYIDADGNVIDGSAGQWVSEEKTGRTLQSRLIENSVRGVVGGKITESPKGIKFKGKPTVASTTRKMISKSKVGKAIASRFGKEASTEATREAAEKYVQNAAKEKASAITNNATKRISKNATKAATKVNVLEKMAEHTKDGSKLNTFLNKSADKVVAKNAASAEKISAKAASKVAKNATKTAVNKAASAKAVETVMNSKMYNSLMGMISRALEKIPTIMSKIPFLKKFASSADEIATILYKNLDDAVKASAGKIGSLISSMSTALVVLKVVFIITDFYTGYQDARTTMGIVEKPTESQRLISGLIRVVKNLIPVISALIPDKALVDLFVNKIAPVMGLDMEDLKRQREEAKNEVETYNEEHGTDYTIEDYNKKVLKDYTTTEKIGNFVKSVKKNIKEKGVVGAIKSGTQEYVQDKVDVFKKNFEEGGPIQAIAETVGSILPGYIGDGAKGTIYMGEMAVKGKVKELLKYTPAEKDDNMLTKILSQISVLVPKIALLPISLVSAGIQKILGFLNLDNMDSLKEVGKDIGSVFKNAFTGNIADMYTRDGGAEGDNMFANILKNLALAVPKVALTPIALITTGVKKLLNLIGIDSFGDVVDIGKDIISIGKNAFTGGIDKMWKIGNDISESASPVAATIKKIGLAIPKIAATPVALITTGIKKLLGVLGIDSFGDVLDYGSDIINMGKYAFTGQIRKLSSVGSDNGDDEKGGIAKWFKKFATFIPKMGFMPVALITGSIKKVLELLGIESFGDVLDIGKDIGSIFKNAFTGKLGDMYATDRSDKNDNAFIKFTKNLALAPPKLVMTPIALITTGIRKILEALNLDSFGDILDLGKDIGSIYKNAFTGRIGDMYSIGSSNEEDNPFASTVKNIGLAMPKIALTPVALITTGIRKVLEALGIESFGDVLDIGKDIIDIGKYAFTGRIKEMYAMDRSGENDNMFLKFTKNLALAIPKISMTPVALITTGIRKVLEALNLDSFADILDLGKDIGSIYKNAFTGKLGDMYSIGSSNDEDSKFASTIKNIGLAMPKIALTPVALITTGIRKVLEALGIESFGDVLDIGKDILSIGKYAITGQIKEMYAMDRSGENDNMFLKFTKNLALAIPKVAATPIALVTTGVRKLIELLGLDSLDSVFDLGKDFGSVFKNAVTGKIGAMYRVGNRNAGSDAPFANVFKNAALSIPKVIMTPVALITTGIRKVLELLNLDSFADILNLGGDLLDIGKYAVTGRIGAMYKVGSSNEEDGTIARVIKNAALAIPKVIMTPVAAVTSGVRFVGEKIAEGIGFLRKATDVDNVIKEVTTAKSIADLWKIKNTVDDDNPYKMLNTIVLGIGKVLMTPVALVKGLFTGIGKFMGNMFEGLKMMKKGVEDFIDDPVGFVEKGWDLTKEFAGYFASDVKEAGGYFVNGIKEKIKGKGSNINNSKSTTNNNTMTAKGSRLRRYVGGNSGFISQYDPEYAGNRYGGSNVSQDGCGPAVAAMAVNNAYSGGNVVSMKDSLAYARRKGYEQKDGTTSDYFGDMFNQYGLGSEYIDNGNGSKSKIIKDRLASGSSVVLLGRDANNTSKANSPFGPGNHYVLATGLDKKGNVIVNDPEMQGPTVYSNKILDSSNLAISTGRGSRIRSRINKINRFKVYSGGASSVERQIFNFLTDKMGLNSAAASGILANIYKESSFNPNTVGDHGTSYGICQWHNGRYTNLRNWCAKNGLDYKTLHGQLCYLNHELTTGYKSMLNKFRSVPDTAEGAYKVGYEWCYSYERPANKQAKSVERGNLAKTTYFPKYKGQKGKYDKDMVISGKADTSVSSSSSSATQQEEKQETGFSKLTSLFGGLMGSFYGNDNPLANLLGFGNSSSESESTTSYEGVSEGGPGNDKQKQLVAMMKSKLGQLTYSMKGPRNPDRGSADCSSTVNWAYKKVYGKDIGNNTASILSNNNTKVVQIDSSAKTSTGTTTSKGPVESGLQPGDILLYSRPTSGFTAGRQYRVGHVEMYAGNGKRIGHGGPGLGPNLTDLSRDGNRFIMAKRLKDVGKGSGIYDSRNYINSKHEIGSIVSIGGASEVDKAQLLKNKAKTAVNTISTSTSDQTMIALIKSIITLLTTMANNSDKINTIAELLQNYFNAKNGNTANNKQKTTTTKKTTKSSSTSTELDAATRELVDYLNSLAV